MTTSKSSIRFKLIAPMVVGIIAGVGATLLMSRAVQSSTDGLAQTSALASASSKALTSKRVVDEDERGRVRALEERLHRLEERDEEGSTSSVAQNTEEEQERADPSAAVVPDAKKDLEMFTAQLDKHSRQPRDAAWAESASGLLHEDFEKIGGELGFKVVNVDCRTTSCVGLLEWPTYRQAVESYLAIVGSRYALNCATGISLPEPDDPSAPYQGSVIFQCKKSRAR